MEANEIQEYTNQMKESGEKGQSVTRISFAISILAVLVALVTVLGHRSHTEAVLAQSRAGDTWNEYQAKKIRFDQVGVATDLLTMLPVTDAAAARTKLDDYRAHQKKWQAELDEQQKRAHELEEDVHHSELQASRYDLGEALLQVGVVLCSITLLTRKTFYFGMGLALGVAGMLIAASALLAH